MASSFNDLIAKSNGAHFVAADLHIHSFGGSIDVKDAGMTPEAIVDAAFKKGLRVIAITDHNRSANVAQALNASQQYAGHLLVIPAVEVTTANGHLLVYFANIATLDKFLTRIEIKDVSATSDGHTELSMASVLTRVGEHDGFAIAAHIDRKKTGFEQFVTGYQAGKRDIISHGALRGFECDDSQALSLYSPDDTGAQASERAKLLRARKDSGIHVHLGHIQSSDAHSIADFGNAPVGTRIKVDDLTYESVAIAFKDPSARVRATSPLPPGYAKIRGVTIEGGFLDGTAIHLNENLNSLIGGRGAGKSTALRAIAHAFGEDPEFGSRSDCPSKIVVYAEDEHGLSWVFEKMVAENGVASALDDPTNVIHPSSFPVEYYGQGALGDVSKNLTGDGTLLQQFLDRHLHAEDLMEQQAAAVSSAREISAQLQPLESSFDKLPDLRSKLKNLEALIQRAEEGNLKEVVAWQLQLSNEVAAISNVRNRIASLKKALAVAQVRFDPKPVLESHDPMLSLTSSQTWRSSIIASSAQYNVAADAAHSALVTAFGKLESDFENATKALLPYHERVRARISEAVAEFERQGLKASTKDLSEKIRQHNSLKDQIVAIETKRPDLERLRVLRAQALAEIGNIRKIIDDRRARQLTPVNRSLKDTISNFAVYFLYEDSGDTTAFTSLLSDVMHRSHLRDVDMSKLARATTPQDLADLCRKKDAQTLKALLERIDVEQHWAQDIIERFTERKNLHELEVCWKPRSPRIKVLTRTQPARETPVEHLSLGQRQTILLTVAMLSESCIPLLIDQPEDDLDNAFIFNIVVSVLRAVKERRQVILVTHNANLAVLGDSELILPLEQRGENGEVFDSGSIDAEQTRQAVENILEGGRDAFRRRGELYHLVVQK